MHIHIMGFNGSFFLNITVQGKKVLHACVLILLTKFVNVIYLCKASYLI